MITFKFYIKDGERFTPIEEFNGRIPDPQYVDTAMEWKINDILIISTAEWDYMDDLLGYIATGLEDLKNQSDWKTSFPDQPIDLTFHLDKKNNMADVKLYIPEWELTDTREETRKATTNLDSLLKTIDEAGRKFFLRMAEIVPERKEFYINEAKRLNKAATSLIQDIN